MVEPTTEGQNSPESGSSQNKDSASVRMINSFGSLCEGLLGGKKGLDTTKKTGTTDFYIPPIQKNSSVQYIPSAQQKPLDFTRKINMRDWLVTVSQCPYKYAYDESGIAIDTINRSVILIQHINNRPIMKTYPFHDIRKWIYEIPGVNIIQPIGNVGVGNSLAIGMMNWSKAKEAQNATGFKVRVKDIDYPEWFIKFEKTKSIETDLNRWMEIFNQYVNDERPHKDITRFLELTNAWAFKFAWEGTGIAVLPKERTVCMLQYVGTKMLLKMYSYSAVLEWKFEIASPQDPNYAGKAIGIRVRVRDPVYPDWLVFFPAANIGSAQHEEEIRQWFSDNIGAMRLSTPAQNYCSNCGINVAENKNFCTECGTRTILKTTAGDAPFEQNYDVNIWLNSVSSCQYRIAEKGTGVAIDTSNRSVILLQCKNGLPISRMYPFADILEWNHELPPHQDPTKTIFRDGITLKVQDSAFPVWRIYLQPAPMNSDVVANDKLWLDEVVGAKWTPSESQMGYMIEYAAQEGRDKFNAI